MTTTGREPASTSAQPVKPCPSSINKVPPCCDYYDEPCDENEGWEDVEGEEGEGEERKTERKRPCRKMVKKRMRPCVRRSQLNLPGQVPEQFGGKPPCRKLPKTSRKKRCRPRRDGDEYGRRRSDDEEPCEEEECEEEDGDGTGEKRRKGRGEGEDDDEDDGDGGRGENTGDGGDDLLGKKPCKKRKRKPKVPKSPCRPPTAFGGPVPKDERIFPSLPRPNLGEKPPEQKFPPAEDPAYDKRRPGPCGTNRKNKYKPCKKQGSDSSSCSSSSSDSSTALY